MLLRLEMEKSLISSSQKNDLNVMILKGEVLIKVSFEKLKVQANAFSSAAIITECYRQVYARAPLTKSGIEKKNNFKIEVVSQDIDQDSQE